VQSSKISPGTEYENTITWVYYSDDDGQVTSETDSAGNQLKTLFDGFGREVTRMHFDKYITNKCFKVFLKKYNEMGDIKFAAESDWPTDASKYYEITGTASYDGWGNVCRQDFTDGTCIRQNRDPIMLKIIKKQQNLI